LCKCHCYCREDLIVMYVLAVDEMDFVTNHLEEFNTTIVNLFARWLWAQPACHIVINNLKSRLDMWWYAEGNGWLSFTVITQKTLIIYKKANGCYIRLSDEIIPHKLLLDTFSRYTRLRIFWLRFWNLRFFFVSYVKILIFYKKVFLIGPLLG
jgi:hypothetical protein